MKKTFIPFIFSILILATGCYRAENTADEQTQNFLVPDSLLAPTGNAELDSLLNLASTAPMDTNLAKLYFQIAYQYDDSDFEKAKAFTVLLGDLSNELDWETGKSWFTVLHSSQLNRQGLEDSSIFILQQGLDLAKQINDEVSILVMSANLGASYAFKKWYQMALQYYLEALTIAEKLNSQRYLGQIYNSMGTIYLDNRAFETAIEYFEKAHTLFPGNLYNLGNLGLVYSKLKQYEKAKQYFEEAFHICELQNNLWIAQGIYYSLGDIALREYNFEKAEFYARKKLETDKKLGNPDMTSGYILLSKLEQLKGNYNKSEEYIMKALPIAKETNNPDELKACYMILSELSVVQHKSRENIQYWDEMDAIDITVAKEDNVRITAEMNVKYETEKKELEIARQQTIIEKQNLQRWLLVGGIAACVLVLALLWYMLRLRNRRNSALQEKTEILAEMNATKNKFFSVISHDLKNPAISLRDALQILLTNANSWDVDALNKYYNELLKSAENHVELIYSLLSWAQIQTGRISFSPVAFSLPKLLPELSMIKKMAENKGITLNITIPEEAVVSCDVNMLLTVVRNLLTNAVKFTPKGGTVTLDVARNTQTHTISISDTGIGMTQQQITELFHLDTLHSHKGTGGEEGSGLGLIICKEFLEKHNSALHIESEEGKGSRVWFEL